MKTVCLIHAQHLSGQFTIGEFVVNLSKTHWEEHKQRGWAQLNCLGV